MYKKQSITQQHLHWQANPLFVLSMLLDTSPQTPSITPQNKSNNPQNSLLSDYLIPFSIVAYIINSS